jgi:hypothetical protein
MARWARLVSAIAPQAAHSHSAQHLAEFVNLGFPAELGEYHPVFVVLHQQS